MARRSETDEGVKRALADRMRAYLERALEQMNEAVSPDTTLNAMVGGVTLAEQYATEAAALATAIRIMHRKGGS
jgi:hypothetical protein